MYAQVEKSKENKSGAVANSVVQKKNSNDSIFQFADNRPESKFQKNLQVMFQNSVRPPFFVGVIQRQYTQDNWEVMAKYNSGSAAKEVAGAFGRAGYVIGPELLQKVIFPIMRANGYGKQKWAHGLGDEQSGHQGDTDERIQKCKNFLLAWAGSHPPSDLSTSSKGSTYKATAEEMEMRRKIKEEKKKKQKIKKKQDYEQSLVYQEQDTEPMSAYDDPDTSLASKFLIEVGLKQGKYPPTIREGTPYDIYYKKLLERYG